MRCFANAPDKRQQTQGKHRCPSSSAVSNGYFTEPAENVFLFQISYDVLTNTQNGTFENGKIKPLYLVNMENVCLQI